MADGSGKELGLPNLRDLAQLPALSQLHSFKPNGETGSWCEILLQGQWWPSKRIHSCQALKPVKEVCEM